MASILRVVVTKVPAKLAPLVKKAITQGSIAVAGERIVSVTIDRLEEPLKEFFNNLPDNAEDVFESVEHAAEEGYQSVKNIVEEAADDIAKAVKELEDKAEKVYKDFIEGMKDIGAALSGLFS